MKEKGMSSMLRTWMQVAILVILFNGALVLFGELLTKSLPRTLVVDVETTQRVDIETNFGRKAHVDGASGIRSCEIVVPSDFKDGLALVFRPENAQIAGIRVRERFRKVLVRTWKDLRFGETSDRGRVLLRAEDAEVAVDCKLLVAVLAAEVLLAFFFGCRRRIAIPSVRVLALSALSTLPFAFMVAFVMPIRIWMGNQDAFCVCVGQLGLDTVCMFVQLAVAGGMVAVVARSLGMSVFEPLAVAFAICVYLETGPLSLGLPCFNGQYEYYYLHPMRSLADALTLAATVVGTVAVYWWQRKRGGAATFLWVSGAAVMVMGASSIADAKTDFTPLGKIDSPLPLVSKEKVVEAFEHSKHKNVAVYIVDSVSTPDIVGVFAKDPTLRDAFVGFVAFTNNVGMSDNTLTSSAGILTGRHYEDLLNIGQYQKSSLSQDTFVADYVKQGANVSFCHGGFDVGMSTSVQDGSGRSDIGVSVAGQGMFARVREQQQWSIFEMVRFQIVPFCLKGWTYYQAMLGWFDLQSISRECDLYPRIAHAKVSDDPNMVSLQYWHTNGSHVPFDVNDELQVDGVVRSGYQAKLAKTRYVLRLLADHFKALMSRGVYDNSFIVVMADHGSTPGPGVGEQGELLPSWEESRVSGQLPIGACPILWVKPIRAHGAMRSSAVRTSHSRIRALMTDVMTNSTDSAAAERILACENCIYRKDSGGFIKDIVVDGSGHVSFLKRLAVDVGTLPRLKQNYAYSMRVEDESSTPVLFANTTFTAGVPTRLGRGDFNMRFRAPLKNTTYRFKMRCKLWSAELDGIVLQMKDCRTGKLERMPAKADAADYLLPVVSDENAQVSVEVRCPYWEELESLTLMPRED